VIEIGLLGPAEIRIEGAPAPRALLWKKHLALLVYLASARGARQKRDHLADLFGGDVADGLGRGSLNEAARVLRRSLGDDAVTAGPEDIGLDRSRIALDTERFAALAGRGCWSEAAALVRGAFLDGLSIRGCPGFEQWLSVMRAHWGLRSLDALTRASADARDTGDLDAALRWAERAAALDPSSDAAVRELMRAHALRGDRTAALAAYEELLRRTTADLGSMPEPETTTLAEHIRRDGRSRPGRAVRPAAPPLVGRARELSALIEICEAARARASPAVAVIYGTDGAGKSRLLDETVSRVRLDGGQVAAVRAVAGDELEAGGTLVALALTLINAPGVPAADPGALAAFAAREPAWRDRFPGAAGAPIEPIDAATAVIRAVAEETLLVLAVDDAHHVDRASLQFLSRLLRDLVARPLVLLLAALDAPRVEEIDLLAAHAGRDAPGGTFPLAPLDQTAIGELAASLLPAWPEDGRERLVRRLTHDGAGLPLLTTALLEAVRAGMELRAETAPWPAPLHTLTATLPGEVPDSVSEAVRLVFRRLGEDSRQVAAAAAVLAERVDVDALAAGTALPMGAVETALDDLERRGWLVWESRGYSFAARLVREIVARDLLTPGQRRRVLARVAKKPPGA
jgi:DNA-binding SARP family transcriptional activator